MFFLKTLVLLSAAAVICSAIVVDDKTCGAGNDVKIKYYEGLLGEVNFRSKRSVGGTKSHNGDFPWVVYLDYGTGTCSGVIVSSKYVITASHCANEDDPKFLPTVFYGDVVIKKMKSVKAKKVVRHPKNKEINEFLIENDIALVELAEPLKFEDNKVSAICLKPLDISHDNLGVLAGFGETFFKVKDMAKTHKKLLDEEDLVMTAPDRLRETTIRTHHLKTCNTSVDDDEIEKKVICAGGTAHGSTLGDSGGPLMVLHNKQWVLYGISSTGYYQGIENELLAVDDYGIYTRVDKYCDFLKENSKGDVSC